MSKGTFLFVFELYNTKISTKTNHEKLTIPTSVYF